MALEIRHIEINASSSASTVSLAKTKEITHLLTYATAFFPYQRKTMGNIWKTLGHIWPIYGNSMGRKSGGMELIWDLILAKCKLWDMCGKKS